VGNGKGPAGPSGPDVSSTAPAGSNGGPAATNPSVGAGSSSTTDSAGQAPTDPNSVAIGLPHLPDSLGLRGAHSVSRAFGAFIGLGLILPLSRFLIRRLG